MTKTEPLDVWNARLAAITRARQFLGRVEMMAEVPERGLADYQPEQRNLQDALKKYDKIARREGVI